MTYTLRHETYDCACVKFTKKQIVVQKDLAAAEVHIAHIVVHYH